MPKMMKILGLFLGLIYISLSPLSAGASDLHAADKKGDIATITTLLDKGADINAEDKNGYTPIHFAAHAGQLRSISVLLDRGADIEARDENGETLLHWAAWKGANDILDTLSRRGADAHAKNNKGETPLDVARIKYLTHTAYQQLQAASK